MYWKAIVVFLILLCIIAYNYHNSTSEYIFDAQSHNYYNDFSMSL